MDPLHLLEASESDRSADGCPFDLRLEHIPAMLNCELVDHTVYDGVELQRWDDPEAGSGMLVFLGRRADGRVDFYLEPGLHPDPTHLSIGAGIGEWRETTFDVARLTVAPDGVDAHVRFPDVDGRIIEVRVDDRDGRRRRRASLLAPVGASIRDPRSLLLVWMRQFDLVRSTGAPPLVVIDGVAAPIGTLPGARLHRRHLVKYAGDLVVATLNRQRDEAPTTFDRGEVEVAPDGVSISSVVAEHGQHSGRLLLEPPFPDVRTVRAGQSQAGRWTIAIDHVVLTGGSWAMSGDDDEVAVRMEVTRPWRPGRLPLLMRIVTTVLPTFRRWPTTYQWSATVPRTTPGALRSRWERTPDSDRGDAYRRATSRR